VKARSRSEVASTGVRSVLAKRLNPEIGPSVLADALTELAGSG